MTAEQLFCKNCANFDALGYLSFVFCHRFCFSPVYLKHVGVHTHTYTITYYIITCPMHSSAVRMLFDAREF